MSISCSKKLYILIYHISNCKLKLNVSLFQICAPDPFLKVVDLQEEPNVLGNAYNRREDGDQVIAEPQMGGGERNAFLAVIILIAVI